MQELATDDLRDSNIHTVEEYVRRMRQEDCWGDQIMLVAAASRLNCTIKVISSAYSIDVKPLGKHPLKSLDFDDHIGHRDCMHLGHICDLHYMAIDMIH